MEGGVAPRENLSGQPRKASFLLATVLLFGFATRLSGIAWGIDLFSWDGQYFHPDEFVITGYLASFPSSVVTNKVFFYPTAVHNLDGVLLQVYRMVRSVYRDAPAFSWVNTHLTERQQIYLIARLSGVVMGTLCSLVVYWTVKSLTGDHTSALVGALAISLMPLPVVDASMATTDVPSSLAAACGLYAFTRARIHDQLASIRYHAIAGALAGLAVATKYTLVFLFGALALLHFYELVVRRRRLGLWIGGTLLAGIVALGVFVLLNPGVVFSPELVGNDIHAQLNYVATVPFSFQRLQAGFSGALGWPMLLLSLIALGVTLKLSRAVFIESTVMIVCFLLIAAEGLQPRYVIPICPVFAVLIGAAWHSAQGFPAKAATWFRRLFCLGMIAASILLVLCLYGRYAWDTRVMVSRYITQNYPEGTSVGITTVGNVGLPQYMPVLKGKNYKIMDGLEGPQVLVLNSRHIEEMRQNINDPDFYRSPFQRFNSVWGQGPPTDEVTRFYSDILAGRSPYKLVREFKKTWLPLEFCGYTLYLYEKQIPSQLQGGS